MSIDEFEHGGARFDLIKNGEIVQSSTPSLMLFSIDELLVYISRYFTLQIGDLIYTGTPQGVGKIESGDHLVGSINNVEMFNLGIK